MRARVIVVLVVNSVLAFQTSLLPSSWHRGTANGVSGGARSTVRPGAMHPMTWEEIERVLPEKHTAEPKLTLYRDNNGWCPFCERVWIALELKGIAYDEKLVDLRNKPEWYKAIVPTTLVPAIEFHDENYDAATAGTGQLVWESMDILKALDEAFPDSEAVFTGSDVEAAMMGKCEELLSSSFKYSYSARNASLSREEKTERKASFETQLMEIDNALTAHGGPFLTGEKPGVADLMVIPMLERYRYQLPFLAGPSSPKVYGGAFPALTRWFDAMDKLPAYMNRCAGDAYSWTAVTSTFLRLFAANSTSEADLQAADKAAEALLQSTGSIGGSITGSTNSELGAAAAVEAVRKLVVNHKPVALDACRQDPKSQTTLARLPQTDTRTIATVDLMLRQSAQDLLESASLVSTRSSTGLDFLGSEEDVQVAATAARIVASRLCAPRDMSAPAAVALRRSLMALASSS